MSNINYQIIVEEIKKFLEDYRHIVIEEHFEELLSNIEFYTRFVNVSCKTSDYGCHFENCPWSSNACRIGPDTCACYLLENRLIRTKKLIALYKRLKK